MRAAALCVALSAAGCYDFGHLSDPPPSLSFPDGGAPADAATPGRDLAQAASPDLLGAPPSDLATLATDGAIAAPDAAPPSPDLAPAGWSAQASPTANDLITVWGLSPTEVVAVGSAGTIVRTTDGGNSWLAVASNVNVDLFGVWGSGADLWVTGDGGTLLHSADGGATWTSDSFDNVQTLYAVWGDGAAHLYLAGTDGTRASVLVSADGGNNFSKHSTSGASVLYSVWGSGATVVGVGDGGEVFRSINAGANWTSMPNVTAAALYTVGGTAGVLWAAGDSGAMIRSADGGATWVPVVLPTNQTLYGLFALDAATVFAVGAKATLLSEANGVWSTQPNPGQAALSGIWGSGPDNLFVVGDTGAILYHP